jgi:hypothetical protein
MEYIIENNPIRKERVNCLSTDWKVSSSSNVLVAVVIEAAIYIYIIPNTARTRG